MAKQKKPKPPKDSSKAWAVMSAVSGILAATATKKLLNGGWKAATGKEPPANPADPDVALREAVLWAAVSGTTIALARMAVGRRAANYYARSTGHLPPELQSDELKERRKQEAAAAAAAVDAKENLKKKAKKASKR